MNFNLEDVTKDPYELDALKKADERLKKANEVWGDVPVPDPWKHRSEGMRCKTCMWFVPKVVNDHPFDLGRCRRHAPTMNGFPAVFVNDWCGDHKLDETKMEVTHGR